MQVCPDILDFFLIVSRPEPQRRFPLVSPVALQMLKHGCVGFSSESTIMTIRPEVRSEQADDHHDHVAMEPEDSIPADEYGRFDTCNRAFTSNCAAITAVTVAPTYAAI